VGSRKAESVVKFSSSPIRLFESLNDRRREIRNETEKCLSQLIANNKSENNFQIEKDQIDLHDDTDESAASSLSSSSTVIRNSRKILPSAAESTPPPEPTTSPPPLEHVEENLFLSNLKSGGQRRESNPSETEIDKVFRNLHFNRPYSASFLDTFVRESSLNSLGSLSSRESSICQPSFRRHSTQFHSDTNNFGPSFNIKDDNKVRFNILAISVVSVLISLPVFFDRPS